MPNDDLHDAAMRIADEAQHGYDYHFPAESVTLLARAYKDVVRDALTPEEATMALSGCGINGPFIPDEITTPTLLEKLRRIAAREYIAARAATEKNDV